MSEITVLRKEYRESIPKAGLPVSMVAAGAGGQQDVYLLSPGRSCKVTKIIIQNNNAAPSYVTFGEGPSPTFTPIPFGFLALNGQETTIPEDMIVGFEFNANIAARASVAAAAPNDVIITIEVDEFAGPTG